MMTTTTSSTFRERTTFPAIVSFLALLLTLFLLGNRVAAQPAAAAKNPAGRANFYEIQQRFNDYWKGRPVPKGSGYKPFKRWEWFWEQRVGRDGEFPPNNVVLTEWEKYRSEHATDNNQDAAGFWVPMGPNTTTSGYAGLGRTSCMAFHPTNKDVFWVGTPSGGLWKTTDFGKNWTIVSNSLEVLGVSDMVIHPVNPDIMYIATGDGDGTSLSQINGTSNGDTKSLGVWKSTDGGVTWSQTALKWSPSYEGLIRRLVINPATPSILYAATSKGIYKISNDGADTTRLLAGNFTDIALRPNAPLVIFAATFGSSSDSISGQIYHTVDGGLKWDTASAFSKVGRIKLATTPQNPNITEALCATFKEGMEGIYTYNNATGKFVKFFAVAADNSNNMLNAMVFPKTSSDSSSGQGDYDLCYLISPDSLQIRWLGGVNTWKSADSGRQNWKIANYWSDYQKGFTAPVVHADKHWFGYHPLQKETFFECNDGGLYYTSNGGKTWTDITQGMQIGQIYRIGCSSMKSTIVMGGFQDNGSQVYNAGSWTAPVVIGGDGMECVVDWLNSDIQYASYCEGLIMRTKTAKWDSTADTISKYMPGGQRKGAWVTPYIIHPDTSSVLYAGYRSLYRLTANGNTWKKLFSLPVSQPSTDSLFRTLAISQSNPKVMYASTKFSLFKTTSGWAQYDTVSLPLKNCMLTGIAIHSKNPDTLYITFSGYSAGNKVYRSYNGGKNWDNISNDLPNLPVNCIVYQKDASDALYVGTDVGVWFRNATMDKWILFNNKLPNVVVSELEIQYEKGKIRAATFGRGLWESELYVPNGKYEIIGVDKPQNGGDVTGAGAYSGGTHVRMAAVPEPGYKFKGWFEEDVKVSDSATYEFDVTSDRILVGEFDEAEAIAEPVKSQIHLFPNPTRGIVEVSMERGTGSQIRKIEATDYSGRCVYESRAQEFGDHFHIDLSGSSRGSYLLTFYFRTGARATFTVVIDK